MTRIPLNTFAIGFGLAGLAEVWDAASISLGLPRAVAQIFWVIAAAAWLWLVVAHMVRGARSSDRLVGQLRHPAQGPIAALVPITGMLLASDLGTFSRSAGLVTFLLFLVVATVFAGWLVGSWLQGSLELDAIHGGYLLPTVAAGFVGADVAAHFGWELLGFALFGVGAFFWVAITTLLILRLASRPSLPDPLVPTMAILVAPPAVAGIAWFGLNGGRLDAGAAALAGLGVLLLLVQAALIPRYRRIAFSLGFWSFTFPFAAVVADAMIWIRLVDFAGGEIVTAVLLILVTGLVAGIAIRSLRLVLVVRDVRGAESVLVAADDVDADGDGGAAEGGSRP